MSFINWIIDSLENSDVIDAYFVQSDLDDINLTEAEIYESECCNALAIDTSNKAHKDDKPLGKVVL